jgi:hypothetical protein|tara:strand:- start:498 stop:1202 length:705 start_codon:yes stop_codon:yes gene_type:complete
MHFDDERLEDVIRHTEILRLPKQTLATFGITNIGYYLVTEPVYSEPEKDVPETVIREGRVITERPRIVTPHYLSQFEGFSLDAQRYFNMLLKKYGPNAPGLFYSYRNEPKGLTIVAGDIPTVVDKINAEIDKRGDPLVTIIKGEDEFWDVSLLKFIYEMTRNSMNNNLLQLQSRGLLDVDTGGVPLDAKLRIEELLGEVSKGKIEPSELKDELDRWGLFEEYQDRLFAVLRKRH